MASARSIALILPSRDRTRYEKSERRISHRKVGRIESFAGDFHPAVNTRDGSPMLRLGSGAARFILELHRCGLAERSYQSELAELDLEGIVFARLRLRERCFSGLVQGCIIELAALEFLFCLARTQG